MSLSINIFLLILSIFLFGCSPKTSIPENYRTEITKTFDEARSLYGNVNRSISLPNVVLDSPDKLNYLCAETLRSCEVRGYHSAGTIVLEKDWNPKNPQDLAFLVHEFVHYFQYLENKVPHQGACEQNYQIEKQAYYIQSQWLESKGEKKLTVRDIDTGILATLRC